MATLLDVGVLGFFLPVFVFMFLFTVLFAVLEKTKILGENRLLNIAAAFSVAAISIFVGRLTSLIGIAVPWIVFVFVILLLIFMIFGFFDVSKEKIWDLFGETTAFIVILIILLIAIIIVFEGTVSPYVPGPDGTVSGVPNPRSETLRTLTHPRMLGAIFMLVVAASTVSYLSKKIT
ncbi:MAG TPA: hypothetical protein VFE88_04320 [Candidatus Nanoarchaeia archaeon]|nr:hypothetical protein [Candidatus Nanoarchaeia archaeon]